ncbi:UNVERIFIED_CONTAM: hypothetical protein HHA_212937 [Hammondia hammondi]|eukprot:XP_008883975.1 hypothetical protein HHA_212937 [Hammondia hammondi]
MAYSCIDQSYARRSNTAVKDSNDSGTPDGIEPYLFPIVACLGCLTTVACGQKDGDFISPAEYAQGCTKSPYETTLLLANAEAGVKKCASSPELQKEADTLTSPSGCRAEPMDATHVARIVNAATEGEGSQLPSAGKDGNSRLHRNAQASPPSTGVRNAVLQDGKRSQSLTDQELLEQIVTDFSLRAVRFDDSDNRTGLPATLIHLENGMQLRAEYHLDFRLQSIHFKLCTKENRFIMFFFVPIKHLKDIAIPEELDPVLHATCYDRVRKFVQRPQRAAVLQVGENWICAKA